MNRKLSVASLLAVLLLRPLSVLGWGPSGHEAVAIIAENSLSPQARLAINNILGPDISLSQIATYADALRYGSVSGNGLFTPPLIKDDLTGPWHYMNIPIAAKLSRTPTTEELNQYPDCGKMAEGPTAELLGDAVRNCLHAQVQFAQKQLSSQDPAIPLQKKRVALMFLVHLAADAHQPLHSADDNDFGGNKEKVIFQGQAQSLHQLWDGVVTNTDDDSKVLAKKLLELLKKLPPEEIASWTAGDLESAVNNAIGESFAIAQDLIYPNYREAAKKRKPGRGVELDANYQEIMQPIAYLRLLKAGVRLGFLLNHAFGQNPQAVSEVLPPTAPANPSSLKSFQPEYLVGGTWDGNDKTPVLPSR